MSNFGDEEEEEEHFFESLDRILSFSSSSSSSSDNDEGDCRRSSFPYAAQPPSTSDPIPSMAVSMYDVWITEPIASVEERRDRLLREMGLSRDITLSMLTSDVASGGREGEMKRSISCNDHLEANDDYTCASSSAISRSRSDSASGSASASAAADSRSSLSSSWSSHSHKKNHCNSSFPPQIHSIQSDITITPHVYNTAHTSLLSVHSSSTVSLPTNNKPPIGKFSRRVAEEIKAGPANSPVFSTTCDDSSDGVVIFDDASQLCTIKNLDNGKEFVVNEFGEDGMWNKLREVGTGRQLTREEFEMCVGHSPIVQELMRRQNVEESARKKDDLDYSGNGGGSRSKKRGGWLKSIKNVACTVTGHRERRSSDERDTSSEKGGRRSSSATDDSQDVLFLMPRKTKVRQYGRSCKELTALYMSQEIRAHNGSIWTIKFSSDGLYLASAGEDRVIQIWQVVEAKRNGDLFTEKLEDGNSNPLFPVNGSPEPALVSSNMENHFEKKRRKVSYSRKSMNLDHVQVPENVFALSEKPFCSFQGHLADVLDLSWSKSQYVLSSSMDKTVRLWDIFSNSCLKVFSHSDYVTCIQFNPVNDDYFISGSLDAKVRIWSIQDRQVVDWNDLHEMVTAACYTPDGQGALVGTHKGNCRLYDTSDNKLHQRSQIDLQNKKNKSQVKKITGFQFAPGSSSEVLVTSADSQIRVVDGVELVHKFKGFCNTNSQISASLTANGKYVLCASEDSHVYVWRNNSDFQPSRSKVVTTTRSYEQFHCPDVSVAIPWPCISIGGKQATCSDQQNELYAAAADTQLLVDEANRQEGSPLAYGCTKSPLHSHISDSNGNYFSDRVSVTWPEESLLATADKRDPQNSNGDLCSGRPAWGMVIVTAGLGGKIKTFQNFGLPIRM